MNFIKGTPRDQLILFNDYLDNIIPTNSHVRVIDAYVESLNLAELGFRIPKLRTGAPPYRPQVLLKIYVYGYFEKIRSSRKLEKECHRNKELVWLTCGLCPDFKTIADFRKNNREGIKQIFKDFLLFCHEMKLLSLNLLAVDGSKMRGQNSQNEVYKRDSIDNVYDKIKQKIQDYLNELDIQDEKELDDLTIDNKDVEKVVNKLIKQVKRKKKVEKIMQEFECDKSKDKIFATDKDCSFQSDQGKIRPGYNVQTAGDSKNNLLMANDVTNASNDQNQMSPMLENIENVKQELGINNNNDILFDNGYYNEKDLMISFDKEDIEVFVAVEKSKVNKSKKNKNKVPSPGYEINDFEYDKENDEYRCPEGKRLYKIGNKPKKKSNGREVIVYGCRDCNKCPSISKCTKDKKGRTISPSINRERIEAFKDLMKESENKKLLAKRKEIIEHPFGTIKRTFGYDYFMQKGLENVKAEFSFICFIYNLKRVLNLFTVKKLVEAINKRKNKENYQVKKVG